MAYAQGVRLDRVKSSRVFVGIQIAAVLLVFACVSLAPPAQGNILLLPLARQAQGQMVELAVAGGATVVQRGPLPYSLVVYGRRAALIGPLARKGILTLAAGAVGCRSQAGSGA